MNTEDILQAHIWGKIATTAQVQISDKESLAIYYTPGVAQPCLAIQADPSKAYDYTWKKNSVAVVTDGSAVLWLGNIGWLAGLPVMEGKSILFKTFGQVDAVPIILNTQDPDEIVHIIQAIAPWFGWINLEDIAAPGCFYIEQKLQGLLDIPVFHDDQHATAIVILAGLINALHIVQKSADHIKVLINGAGAAALATAHLLGAYGVKHIIICDSQGIISSVRDDLNIYKKALLPYNIDDIHGDLKKWLQWADVCIGLSKGNILTADHIQSMTSDSIVFAMANPTPEIMPDLALRAGARIVATGRSDFPNQINNVLVFPGLFRGCFDYQIRKVTMWHKLQVAQALADMVINPSPDYIIPSVFDSWVAQTVALAMQKL